MSSDNSIVTETNKVLNNEQQLGIPLCSENTTIVVETTHVKETMNAEVAIPSDVDMCAAIPNYRESLTLISPPAYRPSLKQKIGKFILKYFLPLGFLSALVIAIVCPAPGKELDTIKYEGFRVGQSICVCICFLISGFTFKTSDIKGAFQAVFGFIFGCVSLLVISPCIAFLVMKLTLFPRYYVVGISIFLCVPTTLTIGVALVEQAGGNAALALMLTIVSNVLGIFTVPFAVKFVLGSQSDASIDAIQLLYKLLFSILLPLGIGKGLLDSSEIMKNFATKYKTLLGIVKSSACIAIVWLALSKSHKELVNQNVIQLLGLVVLTVTVHAIVLVINGAATYLLRVPGQEGMAVVICASEHTFPVTLAVISFLDPKVVGELGILTIPCVVAHMTQLFMDSLLVSRWKYDV